MKYSIPYGNRSMDFEIHTNRVLFSGEMTNIPPVSDFKEELIRSLDAPIASQSLASLAKGKKNILFLVEDNTRDTPLAEILPVVTGYLKAAGIPESAVSFMTAPGTHRLMTDEEVREKTWLLYSRQLRRIPA